MDHLLTIKQEEGESLRSYVKRFNRVVFVVDEAEDKLQLTTFKARLESKEFVVALTKSPPRSMVEMLLKARKYMNMEDTLAVIEQGDVRKDKRGIQEDPKGKKKERGDHSSNHDSVKRRDDKASRTVKFTPLIMPVDKILMKIKDDHTLKWPKPLHSSPSARDKKKYCRFHKDHWHYTKDCRDLKEQIKELIRKGKLQKFVKKDVSRQHKHDTRARSEEKPQDED